MCTFTSRSSCPTFNTTCVSYPPNPIHISHQPFFPYPPLAHYRSLWDLVWVVSRAIQRCPDGCLSPGNACVRVQDVSLTIHYYLRTVVKSTEYEAMSKSRKVEIVRELERRIGSGPVHRGKGLRRVDFFERIGVRPEKDISKNDLFTIFAIQPAASHYSPCSYSVFNFVRSVQ